MSRPDPSRLARFRAAHPGYAATSIIDELRSRELSRLDRAGHVYLDYTGGSLYADSQVLRHSELLLEHVLGNPHSSNPTSAAATRLVEGCRRRVLDFFSADPDEYALVFTANASQALKLVGESYPFEQGDRFLLTFDNHNSVNGIREFDRARGARTTYVPVIPPDLRLDENALARELADVVPGRRHLFAYPAQSNFSGVRHPFEWIERAHDYGWDVLLDAAAYVPTNRLDLSRWHPDFVALSFYKMFGYPTGVGALMARREALARLHRPWFAGGTITVASVQADQFSLADGEAAFEDGTVNYAVLPAIEFGLDLIESIGIELIHQRVHDLTGWLISELTALRHPTDQPLVALYGPASTEDRGGTVTLNFYDPAGRFVDHAVIEAQANRRRISLRTGCFCNPGAGELALGISGGEIATCFRNSATRLTYDEFRRCIDGKSTGAVRVSLGWASSFADVEAFLGFARDLLGRDAQESRRGNSSVDLGRSPRERLRAALQLSAQLLRGAAFGGVQPTAPQFPGRDSGQVGLDVDDRRAIQHVDATYPQDVGLATEQLDHGQTERVGTTRRAGGEDPVLELVGRIAAEQLVVIGAVEDPDHEEVRKTLDVAQPVGELGPDLDLALRDMLGSEAARHLLSRRVWRAHDTDGMELESRFLISMHFAGPPERGSKCAKLARL